MHVNMRTLLLICEASTGKWLQTHPCTCHMRLHNNTRTQDCRDAVTSLKKGGVYNKLCKKIKMSKNMDQKKVYSCVILPSINLHLDHWSAAGSQDIVIDHSSKKCWEDKKSNSHLDVRRQSEEQTHENVADLPNNTKPRIPLLTNFSHSCLLFHFPARANGTCTRFKAGAPAVPQGCQIGQNRDGFVRYISRLLTDASITGGVNDTHYRVVSLFYLYIYFLFCLIFHNLHKKVIKVVNLMCHIPQASSKTNKRVRKHQINLAPFYSWTPWSINRAHISKVRNDVSLLEDTPYPINQTRPCRRHLAAGFWDQLKMESGQFSIFCYCEDADKVLHSREIWSKSFKCFIRMRIVLFSSC